MQGTHLRQEHHVSDAVFSLHPIKWNVILTCPITGNVNFIQLTEVLSARLLHCKITFYPPL